ncbi:hypothetical protein [Butyrivibrio fibrisolvens]|uniref:Uncharacterized protein n=1 Tax=Butyrivibrio fibrisolvens TaxID=831 RepID=A0A317G0Q5_BUTFI|nr:hypothetical protein [Butyrivibrio fibrisolvens]PWT27047.1 hypothetical protein CPT75_07985 [Butyrivibrio fibrisolvens]
MIVDEKDIFFIREIIFPKGGGYAVSRGKGGLAVIGERIAYKTKTTRKRSRKCSVSLWFE